MKTNLTKLSKEDEIKITNLQKIAINKAGESNRNKGLSQDSEFFCFDDGLVPLHDRKQIRKKADEILKKYHFTLPGATYEMLSYDAAGLIEFININLPMRLKLEKEQREYKTFLRLKKKFEKNS